MSETAIHNEHEQQSLEDRIKFESLISEISARFINIPIDRIDPVIEKSLFEILTFFQVDRVGLLRILPDNDAFVVTHLACAPGIPVFQTSVELPSSMVPHTFNKIVNEHAIICYNSLDELPDEAGIDRKTHESFGTRSVLNIPIGKIMPFRYSISIHSVTRERRWPEVYFARLQLLGEIFANILELKKTRIELHDRLKFEEILSRISAQFVNLSPDRLDDAIQNALDQLVRFLGLDRAIVARFHNRRTRSIATHYSVGPGVPMSWKELDNRELPWLLEKLQNEQTVEFSRLEDLPDEARREKDFFARIGVTSCIVKPLAADGHAFGFLGCSTLHAQKTWPKEVIQGLGLVADVFANALARKRADEQLQASEQKYRTVLDFTLDWEYWVNPDGTIQYMSPSCEQITGYPVQEYLDNPDKLKEIIAPEDRYLWDTHFHDSPILSETIPIEFRIFRQDGELRWLEHICRPIIDLQGKFLGMRTSSRDISQRKELELKLRENFREIDRLRQLLEEENLFLRQEIQLQHVHEEIVGRSDGMKRVLSQVEHVSVTDSTVLILGETGTGKELLAKAIHHLSRRRDRPLITVNCACLPPTLMESELFGREKGAYTGALTRMVGRFEVADGSTLFLEGAIPFSGKVICRSDLV
ncbi:MAG: sigma 54-interacting transcriptional regulator [Desulfatirhabdiaceae bacterium]